METSGFTAEQLDVREAVSKICSKYPDVGTVILRESSPLTPSRNTGLYVTKQENIRMSCYVKQVKSDT
jgi:hypothetical protein